HGPGDAVRELRAADRDHDGAAALGAVRAAHALADGARPEPLERAGNPPAARDRQEERDPAGGLRERAAPAGHAAARGARAGVRDAAAPHPHDDRGDHRGSRPDGARRRRRRDAARRHRDDDHRRAVSVSAADAPPGARQLFARRRRSRSREGVVAPPDYRGGANGPASGRPWVLASGPSSAATPRRMAAVSLPAWKHVKSGRSRHASGPQSRTPALIALSWTMLIAR